MAVTNTTKVQKLALSGSTNGRRIKVVATASAGTLIHTASDVTGEADELWLDAYNSDTATRTLTIQWGGTTAPDDHVVVAIPAGGTVQLPVSGNVITGNGTPLLVRAFASVANVVTIGGYVNRMV